MPIRPDSSGDETSHDAYLFEVAWEVCNQVGGIYTVLKTKVPAMLRHWGDNYFLVGPYNSNAAAIEFEETTAVGPLLAAIEHLEQIGIRTYFGRWLIEGRPYVILLDYRSRFLSFEQDKYFLWKEAGISTEQYDPEVNEMVAFGSAAYEFFRAVSERTRNRKLVAHFHEWMAGVALPRITYNRLPIATVFTTHATLLGRYIASDNPYFYDQLNWIDPEAAARHYNIYSRYVIERIAAQRATVFTTISEVTAREAEHFLGRKPDLITPNGINVQRFAAPHEFQHLHLKYKERIHEFVIGHFFPSYTFDIDRTRYIFTSGRYEYRNKGMDLFIEALFRLNQRLKEFPDPPTIVAFIITKAPTRNINVGVLQSHLMFEDMKNICLEIESGLGQRLVGAVARGQLPTYEELLSNNFQVRLKRAIHAFKRDRLPPIVTHDLADDARDSILQHLRHRGLFNQAGEPVKVVFHPEFVSATSPLLGLDYDQFVRGCHLGVFPSYYEPWGYTPLECLALGLPTITTDLSGFGGYVQEHIEDHDQNGIYVLRRAGVSPDQSIDSLTNTLVNFAKLNRRGRIELRNRAERVSEVFDWQRLAAHYHSAHDLAIERLLQYLAEAASGMQAANQ